MKTVKVIFEDSQFNYSTNVNPKCSNQEIEKYFVGNYFDMGFYPIENMQKCINIEIK